MKPQQILNKLAKYNEVQKVELSSEEPIKVEFALADNLAAYAKGVSKYKSEGDALAAELKKAKDALLKLANLGWNIADDAASDLVKFEKAAKELGIDPNSNPDYKAASAAFQEYNRLSKEYIAITKK